MRKWRYDDQIPLFARIDRPGNPGNRADRGSGSLMGHLAEVAAQDDYPRQLEKMGILARSDSP